MLKLKRYISFLILPLLLNCNSSVSGIPVHKRVTTSTLPTITCPLGYVVVPQDLSLGVQAFCVMKFHAKDVASVPNSTAAGLPWGNINLLQSIAACQSLGAKYDLISNPEWMAIARNIESVGTNWSGGAVGTGELVRGFSWLPFPFPWSVQSLSVSDESDPYDQTGKSSLDAPGSGWEQRRTFHLSNGNIIWDFSGNVLTWVKWTISGATTGPVTCINEDPAANSGYGAFSEITLVPTLCGAALVLDDYSPSGMAYTRTEGVGTFFGGVSSGSGGAPARGAAWYLGTDAGIYALGLNYDPNHDTSANFEDTGFRCVYRP